MSNQVAQTIAQQIGNKAFFMMGTLAAIKRPNKCMIAGKDSLSFPIGRNSKGVTHVTVTLTSMDDYTVRFTSCRGAKITEKGTFEGIYCDNLHSVLKENTGLDMSL